MWRPGFALACVLISSPGFAAGSQWETITSAEGGFTIDMPAKPTMKESESHPTRFGLTRFFMLGCHTDDGGFIVFRIDFPAGMPRGVEQGALDSIRDSFAQRWHGRVVSEKKVFARGNPGRDFTIRGNPEGDGIAFVRVRLYMVGRSMFAVAVVSPPNQELPEETGRFLGSLALGGSRERASGTPEPDPPGKNLPGWGTLIDPDGDCKFTPGNRSMTIEVPTTQHDLDSTGKKLNAPRVMHEVDGDFILTVRVTGEFKPGPNSTSLKSVPYNGAGILVWSDSDNHIRFERANWVRGGVFSPNIAFLECEGGYPGANHSEGLRNEACYLRMQRKGSRIYAGISSDGNNWRWLKPIDTIWPAKLKVGLTAISTSSTPFVVKFEEFELRGGTIQPAAGGSFTPAIAPAQPAANNSNAGNQPSTSRSALSNSPSPDLSAPPPKSRTTMIVAIIVVCSLLVLLALVGLGGAIIWMLVSSKATPQRRPARSNTRRRRNDDY